MFLESLKITKLWYFQEVQKNNYEIWPNISGCRPINPFKTVLGSGYVATAWCVMITAMWLKFRYHFSYDIAANCKPSFFVGNPNNITQVVLIILFTFSSLDQRTIHIISDMLFLKYHTRNIFSIRSTLKDQYYSTESDNGFSQNEGKWSDRNNEKS